MNRPANLMVLLQRFRIDDDFVQLKTAIDLTKSLMERHPEKKYAYGPNYVDGSVKRFMV